MEAADTHGGRRLGYETTVRDRMADFAGATGKQRAAVVRCDGFVTAYHAVRAVIEIDDLSAVPGQCRSRAAGSIDRLAAAGGEREVVEARLSGGWSKRSVCYLGERRQTGAHNVGQSHVRCDDIPPQSSSPSPPRIPLP